MGSKEILTLQFGHFSNFVGTHWWNIQESGFEYNTASSSEIDHDVLYREGQTSNKDQPTYTPRLLLVDLKGSLRNLPKEGDLYEPPVDPNKVHANWHGKVDIQKEHNEDANQFQKDLQDCDDLTQLLQKPYHIENDVKVWSDFLYSRFHPRTVNIVNEYQQCNENTPFDAFPVGSSLWKSPQFDEEFIDKIRVYVEECDRPQGFHILADSYNAFSGLSSSCLEYLRDEYERKPILVLPVIPSYFNDLENDPEGSQSVLNDSVRVLNLLLSFHEYSQNSSLFVPLCTGESGWRQPGPKRSFYHTEYNHENPYHTSAILASALETFTLKHRLTQSNFSLIDLCMDLTPGGRKAAAASLCLPFSFNKDSYLMDCLDNWEGPSQSITPRCTIGTERVMQHITLRGISEERLKIPLNRAGKLKDLPAYKCNSITEMLNLYLACNTYATANNVTVVQKPMPVRAPYPMIFDKRVGLDGNIDLKDRQDDKRVDTIPILSGLHSCSGVGDMLESLHTEARKIKLKRFHQFTNNGIEADHFEECLDKLFEMRENYDDNYCL